MKIRFDISTSRFDLLLLSPLFGVMAIWIKLDSEGIVFHRLVRTRRGNRDFRTLMFRLIRVETALMRRPNRSK